MFATIGHTIDLMKMSWRVLMLDRELIFFPVMSVAAMVLLAVAIFAGGLLGGAFGLAEEGGEGSGGDLALALVLAFGSSFIVIFFNAALVAASLERLRGGDPNVASGLKAASAHIPQILGWALITTVVTLILQALRDRGGIAGQVASMLGGIAWSLATFFVIPLLVAEGIGPIEAIRRSSSLLRDTWGRQIAASFGFGIVTIGAIIVAAIPGLLLALVHPLLGLAVGIPLVGLAWATVTSLEGIFKAALYDFAIGKDPHGFDRATLQNAYGPQTGSGMRGII
ncbi:MAG: hypothetical protein F4Z77_03205 [Dehalococcoidia bacterium]|nr:hypothetical protein [Dehalococcoidia bacterium]MYA53178.1 hypothetical protein [Dehalococcoidia bacterium]